MDTLSEIEANLVPDGLLRALAREELKSLLKKATRRDLKTGETIINQGDETGDFAVYLLSGGLKVSFVSAGGREIILNYCAPGELVGEIALLDSGPRTATVTAVSGASVLLLPTHAFLDAVSSNPTSAVRVMQELARRVRQQNLVIESDRTFSMGPRLARALVRLIHPDEDDGKLLHNPSTRRIRLCESGSSVSKYRNPSGPERTSLNRTSSSPNSSFCSPNEPSAFIST